MAGTWLEQVSETMGGRRGTRHAGKLKLRGQRTLRLEVLEARSLLSLNVPCIAIPHHVTFMGAGGVTPMNTAVYTPAQIRQAYGFDKIFFNNGKIVGDGTGTTIAIVDAYDDPAFVSSSSPGYAASDLHQFNLAFGLADSTFTKVNQNGLSTMPAPDPGWAGEIALDVEWVHAIAPGASILLVEADSNLDPDLFKAVDYARHAAGVVAVSMSWGGPESPDQFAKDAYFTTPANHAGVTFLASTGDNGSPINSPSSSPNVVAVGGTNLQLTGQDNWSSESAWTGSGGGISQYESQPAYQKGVVTQNTTFRTNPDVSYDADPNTGFFVYDSYNNGSLTPWTAAGGTSASAPQWAALIGIADQGRALAGKGSLDGATETLPMLYGLPAADFHDIVTGHSVSTPQHGGTPGPSYSAVPGYDLATGRGTPIANLVVRDLVGVIAPPPGPTISGIVVAEATWQNGVLAADERGVITWALTPLAPTSPVKSYSLILDGKILSAVYGPFGPYGTSTYYAGVFNPLSAGTHTYTIGATDTTGGVSTTTGTFTVAAIGPVISQIVVAEVVPSDGVLTSKERGVLTWAVTGLNPIVNSSVKIDNKVPTSSYGPYGPYSGDYYYCGVFGPAGIGTHTYSIRATDNKGVTTTYSGSFAIASAAGARSDWTGWMTPAIAAQLAPMIADVNRQFPASPTAHTSVESYSLLPHTAGVTYGTLSDSRELTAIESAIPVEYVDIAAAIARGISQTQDEAHADSHGPMGSNVLGEHSLFSDDALLPISGEDASGEDASGEDAGLATDRPIDSHVADLFFASVAATAV